MDARQQQGLEIAATAKITKRGRGMWSVPSQSLNGRYIVTINANGKQCTCPDFELRQQPCKHVFAIEYVVRRETVTTDESTLTTETAAVRSTYAQDWPSYNRAQTSEKEVFQRLLHDLCANVPDLPQTMGRPRLPVSDQLFSAAFKVYSTFSGRRFMTDMREAQGNGLVSRAPHYNSIFRYLESEELTPVIHRLIVESALPLKAIETDFAIDSTGFTSTQLMGVWRTEKYGTKEERAEHNWLKLHAMCGVQTNVVTAVEVTGRNTQDCPRFKPLLEATARHFDVGRVLGDKAYSSHDNLELAEKMGAVPFVPFKTYAIPSKKSETWTRLLAFYTLQRDDFLRTYHKRSNAESTFSAIKRVFGDFVRSKTPVAQVNEVLLKVLAHNIRCLIHSMYELGITPTFGARTPVASQILQFPAL